MQALDAFKIFHAAHRKSALFIHTSASDPRRGFPIAEYATHLNLGHAVFGLPAYPAALKLDRRHMAWLYSAFDCLLAASAREGFGLPIIEAQSCGTPVIVNDTTSMPELVGSGAVCAVGWRRWNDLGSYASHPDVSSLHRAMQAVYRADREALARRARRFVVANYDMDAIFERRWVPYPASLELRVRREQGAKRRRSRARRARRRGRDPVTAT